MRPLNLPLSDRGKPNPEARPKDGRRRASARRAPPPAWREPALRYGLPLVAAGLLLGLGFWSWQSGLGHAVAARTRAALTRASIAAGLTVQDVEVQGRTVTPARLLLAALGIRRGDPILFFDAEAARERLEHIGWVKTASVQRLLPGTILIRVVERQPFARWQIDGRMMVIDRDGVVLTAGDPERYGALKLVVGQGAADHAGPLFDMLTLEPGLARHVAAAVRVRDRRWDIDMDNGITVRLPEFGAAAAWRELAVLERQDHVLGKALVAIDMRLADRVVFQLTPAAAAAREKAPGRNKST